MASSETSRSGEGTAVLGAVRLGERRPIPGMEKLEARAIGRQATFLLTRGSVKQLPGKFSSLEGIYVDGAPNAAYRKNPVRTACKECFMPPGNKSWIVNHDRQKPTAHQE